MAANDFETVKYIDQPTTDTVNGYIKKQQNLLPHKENPYYLIPPLVTHLILLYYFNNEYFVNTPKGYIISHDKKTIQKTEWSTVSMYGNIIIPSTRSGIYYWSFKVLQVEVNLTFGITSDIEHSFESSFWSDENHSNYGAMYSGHKVSKANPEFNYSFDDLNNNDIVKMELDLNKKELSYWVNDKYIGPAYTDIDVGEDIKYKMAVDMMRQDTKVQFIDFSRAKTKKEQHSENITGFVIN